MLQKVPEAPAQGRAFASTRQLSKSVNLNTLKKIRECEFITPALFDEVDRERVATSLETAAVLAETSRLRREFAQILNRSKSSIIGVVQRNSARS